MNLIEIVNNCSTRTHLNIPVFGKRSQAAALKHFTPILKAGLHHHYHYYCISALSPTEAVASSSFYFYQEGFSNVLRRQTYQHWLPFLEEFPNFVV